MPASIWHVTCQCKFMIINTCIYLSNLILGIMGNICGKASLLIAYAIKFMTFGWSTFKNMEMKTKADYQWASLKWTFTTPRKFPRVPDDSDYLVSNAKLTSLNVDQPNVKQYDQAHKCRIQGKLG